MADLVEPNLYVGNWDDARQARTKGWDTLCVIETPPTDKYKGMTYYVPILEHDEFSMAMFPPLAIQSQLDKCSEIIDHYLSFKGGSPLLVHCYAGIERSPLTLAYWLVKTCRKADLNEAYAFLKSIRPIVEDRRLWLPPSLATSL